MSKLQLNINKERFNVLRKMGVKKIDMRKSILAQALTIFISPLILALLHSLFISNVLYNLILELSSVGLFENIFISLVIILVTYGSYLFASYYESLNIINDKN